MLSISGYVISNMIYLKLLQSYKNLTNNFHSCNKTVVVTTIKTIPINVRIYNRKINSISIYTLYLFFF